MKFTLLVVTMVLLLQLVLPAAAQDRCVQNPYRVRSTAELAELRQHYNQGTIFPGELRRLRELEELEFSWADRKRRGKRLGCRPAQLLCPVHRLFRRGGHGHPDLLPGRATAVRD